MADGGSTVWAEVDQRLSLIEAAERLGLKLQLGLQSSPFRDDKKASFSVFRGKNGAYAFKDHADDTCKGGLWQFVQLARPGWSNKEIARWLFDASGVDPQPSEFSKGKAAEARRVERDKAFMEARMEACRLPVMAAPEAWSAEVERRWENGAAWADAHAVKLAKSRGWPESDTVDLVGMGYMSGPLVPWADHAGDQRQAHGVAFKVQWPARVEGRPSALRLIDCGYHQRFVTIRKADDGTVLRGKHWVFVPYVPEAGKVRSEFQRSLLAGGRSVAPLPFVIGDLDNPRLVVVLEGQWDALTFWIACGWVSDGGVPPVAVFGLRGVNGVESFLGAYGEWMRRVRPVVWMIGDNDSAGRSWARRRDTHKIKETPSFVDRLQHLGCKRVIYRTVAEKYGKDFNDFYKSTQPDAGFMARWMESLGVEI